MNPLTNRLGAVLPKANEGASIPENALPHLFRRFYRVESSRSGDGFGLAITRETVEALEGQIEIKSVPGKDSTFTVRLPLSERLPAKEEFSGKISLL